MAVDGYLNFDTKVNTKGFNAGTKQITIGLGSLKSSLGKLGAAVAVAFSAAKLIQFGKKAIETASDLEEVQNVVDVAFGDAKGKMEEFADTAITQFGISELAAKKTGSTFMAMAVGMGMARDAASDMALSLTGLSADMASFYNIEQSEAQTALSAVFTGETETLKRYGIAMTEVNLQEFALAHGINTKVSALSQAEKVQLRYNYIMQQTVLAQGDFARTANSWANQTKILSMQWQQFSGVVGKALKSIFLPAINSLNRALGTLINVASSAYNTLAELFGWETIKPADVFKPVQDMGDAIGNNVENQEALTDAVNDTAKANERSLAGFDKINKLQDNSSSGGSGGGGAGGGLTGGNTDIGIKVDADTSKAEQKLSEFKRRWEEGDYAGIGQRIGQLINAALYKVIDTVNWDDINKRVETNVSGFAQVVNAAFETIDWEAAGSILGNGLNTAVTGLYAFVDTLDFTEIGKSIGELLTGALREIDFKKVGATIIDWVTALPDFIIGLITGTDFSVVGKAISDTISGAITAAKDWIDSVNWTDVGETLKQKIKEFIGGIEWGTLISELWGLITAGITGVDDFLTGLFGEEGAAVIEGIAVAIGVVTAALGIYNTVTAITAAVSAAAAAGAFSLAAPIALVVVGITALIAAIVLCVKHWDEIKEAASKAADWIQTKWESLKTWFLEKWEQFKTSIGLDKLIAEIKSTLTVIFETIKAVWEEVKAITQPLFDFLKIGFQIAWAAIKTVWSVVVGWFKLLWEGIKAVFSVVATFFKCMFSTAWTAIKSVWRNVVAFFTLIWAGIKAVFAVVKTVLTGDFSGAWTAIKNVWSKAKSYFLTVWTGIKNVFGSVGTWFKETFSKAWQKVKDVFSSGGKIFTGIKDGILDGLKGVVNGLIGGINRVIAIPFNGLNTALRKIRDISFFGKQPFSGLIHTIDIPQIPKLATGTVVPANYGEFLAVLGDNKREAEIVSPESAMKKAMSEVMAQYGGCETINLKVDLDGQTIYKTVVKRNRQNTKQTGVNALAS